MRVVLAIALLASSCAPIAEQTPPSEGPATPVGVDPFAVCGTLAAHDPATPERAGSITIGGRTFPLASGTVLGNAGVEVALGAGLCVVGTWSLDGILVRYTARWLARDERYCGGVLSVRPGTARISWEDGDLDVHLSDDVPTPAVGERVCYVAAIGDAGALVARSVEAPDGPLELEWVNACGRVFAYEPATAGGPGRVRIGTWERAIAPGVAYTGDPAGDRTDRTEVGTPMCLSGKADPSGALIEYLTAPMHRTVGFSPVAYRPQTASEDGYVLLTARSRLRVVIPAGSEIGDLSRGSFCFRFALAQTGDAALGDPCVLAPPAPARSPTATRPPVFGEPGLDPAPGELIARATGSIPRDRAFVVRDEAGEVARLWLVDLTGATPPVDILAMRRGAGPAGHGIGWVTASEDGSVAAFTLLGPPTDATYRLDVRSGAVVLMSGARGGVLSPDGREYAYADAGGNVRVRQPDGGTRLVARATDPSRVGGTWQALAWSPDGSQLALGGGPGYATEIAVVRADGSEDPRAIGGGVSVSWRARAPEILITSSRSPFTGGQTYVATVDLVSGARQEIDRADAGDTTFSRAVWHPTEDRFAYFRTAQFTNADGGAWVHDLRDGSSHRLTDHLGQGRVLWSRDGDRLYALLDLPGRFDVVDAATGATTVRLCPGGCR